MTKTERLFALLQLLRDYRYPVSGKILADKLDISLRTLYRDIADLQSQGADIEGEAGLGFQLKPGFMLPPLMFNADEVDTLVLSLRWAMENTDTDLKAAAQSALSKISAILPAPKREQLALSGLMVGPAQHLGIHNDALLLIRQSIQKEHKVQIDYQDANKTITQRIVWPIGIAFFDECRMIIAWCELRQDFRHFRVDRLSKITPLDDRYPTPRPKLLNAWRKQNDIPEQ